MAARKCLELPGIPRRHLRRLFPSSPRSALAVAVLVAAARFAAAQGGAILPRDAAARAYEEGRALVRRGSHAEGIRRLDAALATGHTKPAESFGTSRHFVDRYDPDYWLGVAYMELGDDARARTHLARSRANALIARWPEGADLDRRLELLERRAAAARSAPAPTPPPAPTATAPPPTATPIPSPTGAPTPPSETPAPLPAEAALPTPRDARPLTAPPELVKALVGAIASADWAAAEAALGNARVAAPEARELELLEAVMSGTRYLLEGSRDASLLERARRSLSAFRQHGGSRRAEDYWISPALAAALRPGS